MNHPVGHTLRPINHNNTQHFKGNQRAEQHNLLYKTINYFNCYSTYHERLAVPACRAVARHAVLPRAALPRHAKPRTALPRPVRLRHARLCRDTQRHTDVGTRSRAVHVPTTINIEIQGKLIALFLGNHYDQQQPVL